MPHLLKELKGRLPLILSLIAIGLFLLYLYENADRLIQLLDVSSPFLVGISFMVLIFLLINGLINHQFYRSVGIFLSVKEAVGLAAVNTLANQLPFAGGLAAKGIYLKRKHRLDYTRYLSATMALYVCFVAANGVIGLAILLYWLFTGVLSTPIYLWFGFSGMAASLFVIWVPLKAKWISERYENTVVKLMEGWLVLRQKPFVTVRLILLQCAITVFFAGRFWLAFRMVSQEVSLGQCILFASATVISRLVSIAPGGIGVREGIVAGLAALLGFDAGPIVLGVGIDRLIATTIIILVGTIYTYILSRKLSKSEDC
jgi:uncharacterized membrane protein YbhN (UPF0104 family)